MNKRNNKKHNKRIIIATIILVGFSIYSLVAARKATSLENGLKDTISNIEYYVVKAPFRYIGNIFSEYTELKDVYRENETLKQQLDTYARLAAMNDTLSSDINSLKEVMNLHTLPTDYKVKYTHVIQRDVENWSKDVSIDVGANNDIKEGMAVISSKGIIGTVTHVNTISSTVSLLCDENPNYQLPIMILNGEEKVYGLLDRYDVTTRSYVVILLSDIDSIQEGSTVVTSGLGGVDKSPKGILVGKVDNASIQSVNGQRICYITPSADFNELEYVAVVQRNQE